jgi:FemAB-related protein (PEP-CTERM system-associated)
MPEIRVRKLEQERATAWPDALVSAGKFTALDSWSSLVHKTYSYEVYRFEAVSGVEVVGILVLTHVRHPIFGNYLATSPFGSYGGFAFASIEVRDTLLKHACMFADELGVEYAVVRFLEDGNQPPTPWLQNPIYSTYLLDLAPNAEDLMKNFGHQHRKHTRQAMKKGFKIQFGQLDLLDETYEALARSMHELGSPYHPKQYLQKMAELLGDCVEFAVIKDASNALVGSAVLIYHHGVASNLHANILHEFRSGYVGEFLYWSLLEHHCQKGLQVCDMGRSLNGSGNETFKLKWRPRQVPLAYWYYLPKGGEIPELNQKSPKFRFAIWLWKRLPAFVVRMLGPSLIRGIV